jgi:hypothetical protein
MRPSDAPPEARVRCVAGAYPWRGDSNHIASDVRTDDSLPQCAAGSRAVPVRATFNRCIPFLAAVPVANCGR